MRIVTGEDCEYESSQLQNFLEMGGNLSSGSRFSHIFVGNTAYLRQHYSAEMDSLRDDGYLICSDGRDICLFGKGEKGTLYAVYAFLEMLGYRLYTPDALVIPDSSNISHLPPFPFHLVENPAFAYREVSYYYPNHSQLYADWHHLHTEIDREGLFGMFVHTFSKLLPPSRYFDRHPEWYSLNNGRRSRDGQLCLSNPEVLDSLCVSLEECISKAPDKKIWSVSPNDNYNVCECENCRRMDSLYGGPTGTLLHFVNQVACRFPDKTISTLAYQYTRCAPKDFKVKPDSNVNIMFCSIECGRELPIADAPKEADFRKDMEDWSRLTDNIYMWDYVVQFRNFWNPFPNLHVLQPNLQYFRDHGVRLMFEQATGATNITSWMDIRCYMLAKLLWNPDVDIDSIMADFYLGYYGDAGRYVKEIIDTMTSALLQSGLRLDIYGYPVDGCFTDGIRLGYLWPSLMDGYYDRMRRAYATSADSAVRERLRFFDIALDYASIELKANDMYGDFEADDMTAMVDSLISTLKHYGVDILMEMGVTPDEYGAIMRRWCEKTFSRAKAYERPNTLRKEATSPYNTASLTDGEGGILDYRRSWLGFWGDTLDATVALGDTKGFTSVSLDFYFYPLSWIFLPERIEFMVSDDGRQWRKIGEKYPENPEILAIPGIHTFTYLSDDTISARNLRVIAYPIKEIPSWHRAAGQKAWIFTDEIIIK